MTGPSSAPGETPAPFTGAVSERLDAGAGAHLVVHALRVKQVATVAELATMTSLATGDVECHLASCEATGDATLRVRHQLWQLTPEGMARHARWLADEAAEGPGVDMVRQSYANFLPLNVALKEQCGQWQLRHGQPNDHGDLAYDAAVIDGLGAIARKAAEVLTEMSAALPRFAGYRPRLGAALARLVQGDTDAFTGVLCGSYHDVWMELHQDLIVTLDIDRRAEGSV